jgi:glucokinase
MNEDGYLLVGDIGGTNARFALVQPGGIALEAVEVLPSRHYSNIDAAISDYFQRTGVARVQSACLAVAATPGSGNRVKMTNNHWCFDSEELQRRFGWDKLKVINDYTAMALGIPQLATDQMIHVCGGPGDSRRPRLVMGPGTGLGVSALVALRSGWLPLMTEGGHVDFTPTDRTEMAILDDLRSRFGRVSAERVLSGQGLLNLYQAHAQVHKLAAPLDTPEKITAAAIDGTDVFAQKVLSHFCEILGRVAGNAVLTLGSTGGVYLCGGMLPHFIDFFLQSPFQSAFEDKGRMREMLSTTPVYVVTDDLAGLSGAAEALTNPEVPDVAFHK